MLRLLRILPRVPALALVMGSLLETLKNLKHCAGILFAAFYLYASFGMILFQGESYKTFYGFKYFWAKSLTLNRLIHLRWITLRKNSKLDFGRAQLWILWSTWLLQVGHHFLFIICYFIWLIKYDSYSLLQ